MEGIKILEKISTNPETGMTEEIAIKIQVPESFPAKYYDALIRSADQCAVKKHIEKPPKFNVYTVVK